jgi:hypothetical protein
MAVITVTITAIADGPFQLLKLFQAAASGASVPGVTITPSGSTPPETAPSKPGFLMIEADETNASNYLYTGDQNLPATGSSYSRKLAAGDVDQREGGGTFPLAGVYINASADGVIANITATGGFQ